MGKGKNYRNIMTSIFGVTILAFIVLISFAFYLFYDILVDARNNEIKLTLKSYTVQLKNQKEKFDHRARRISSIARTFYELNNSGVNDFNSIEREMLDLLTTTTTQLPNVTGIGIWFEPYKFDKTKFYYGPYSYWKNDSVVLTWEYSNQDYNYFNWNWYTNALPTNWDRMKKRSQDVYWSEIFYDSVATKETMISLAAPIYSKKEEIIGVATVDLGMKKLMKFVDEMKVTPNSNSFLIQNSTGKIITFSSDTNLVLNSYSEIKWLNNLDFKKSKSEILSDEITINDEDFQVYYSNSVGSMLLGIIIPKSDIYQPLWQNFYLMLAAVFLLSLITFLILRYTVNRIYSLVAKNKDLSTYFYNVMNSTPDAIIIHDEKGNFVDVNDSFCGLYEYSKEESKNLNVGKISSSFYPEELAKDYLNRTLSGEEMDFDWIGLTKSGVEFPALVRLRNLVTDNSKHVIAVVTDMTEIVAVENDLKQLNQELEERVEDRTLMLQLANENLEVEIQERLKAEENLVRTNEELLLLNQTIADDSQKLLKLNENLLYSEKLLREANFTKDKFFSIIAHDLRNPMHAIKINIDFLNSEFNRLDNNYMQELLKSTGNATNHLYELLENLLLWSRSQSGKISFNPDLLNLHSLLIEIVNLYTNNLEKKSINCILEVDTDYTVYADENMLKTILRNLISNALKFTPEKGRITVTAAQINDNNVISIIDTGIGMTLEEADELLNYDNSNTKLGTSKEKGTGLGFILCKEFVAAHGGRIEIESKKGKGTKMIVIFPNKD